MNRMKTITVLKERFRLAERNVAPSLTREDLARLEKDYDTGKTMLDIPHMPMQVHEILIHHGKIDSPAVTGSGAECLWVAQKDWVYVTKFPAGEPAERVSLTLMGLDVLADVYVNGVLLGKSRDVFLPFSADIRGLLAPMNTLVIHFHSPHAYLDRLAMPKRYQGKIMPKHSLLRCYHRGYDDYLGMKPYLTRVGVYDDILLETSSRPVLSEISVPYELMGDMPSGSSTAVIRPSCTVCGAPDGTQVRFTLSLDGRLVDEKQVPVTSGAACAAFAIENPALWWCVGYGGQPLYTLRAELTDEGDALEKTVGLRKISLNGDFNFFINNVPLKIWGANLAPVDALTGCYQAERTEKIVDAALDAHMNCLRVWGGGDRFPDGFYDLCDRKGLLLWQDFFHDFSMYPEEESFRELCRREARHQTARLRHHPSIFLWCGSNESVMCRDFINPGEECIGQVIYEEDYRQICAQMDPERFYLPTSPWGGSYANDPLKGDTHSYTSTWFVPGGRQPVYLSENMRAFPPALHSLTRMIGQENLWPDGYTGQQRKNEDFPWPDTWRKFTSADGWRKIAPVERFYDADDVPSMIYRFQAATAVYILECVGRYRRGRPAARAQEQIRLTQGHLWWKMNTSAPHIYSGLLDYYLEKSMPYYAIKQAYAPFALSFDVEDFITLWAVNDTRNTVRGRVTISLFHLKKNTRSQFFDVPFEALPGQSVMIAVLNRFGQFTCNEHVLHARAVGEDGQVLYDLTGYADAERHMQFPDCRLALSLQGNLLTVETDCFARCVALTGDYKGDAFQWEFSDNYFDLLPGQAKRIRISGPHPKGVISAKGHYASQTSTIAYQKEE